MGKKKITLTDGINTLRGEVEEFDLVLDTQDVLNIVSTLSLTYEHTKSSTIRKMISAAGDKLINQTGIAGSFIDNHNEIIKITKEIEAQNLRFN